MEEVENYPLNTRPMAEFDNSISGYLCYFFRVLAPCVVFVSFSWQGKVCGVANKVSDLSLYHSSS